MIQQLKNKLKAILFRIILTVGFLVGSYFAIQMFWYEPTGFKLMYIIFLMALSLFAIWRK